MLNNNNNIINIFMNIYEVENIYETLSLFDTIKYIDEFYYEENLIKKFKNLKI